MTQDKLSEELLSCPFCGGEGRVILPALPLHADCTEIVVHCVDCGICGPGILFDQTEQTADDLPDVATEAIAAWNRRALRSATPMPGVKALEWGRDHIGKEWHGNVVHGTGYNYLVKDDGRWCNGPNRIWVLGQIGNVEAAKAAAQADYEARILSALTTPPAREISEAEVERALVDEAVDEALEEAIRFITNIDNSHKAARLVRKARALRKAQTTALEAARSPS